LVFKQKNNVVKLKINNIQEDGMEDKWLEAEGIDVEKIMEEIRKRVEDKKKKGIYKEEEIEDIENVELLPLPDILDVPVVYSPEDLEKSYKGIESLSERKIKELREIKRTLPQVSGAKRVIRNFVIKIRSKIFPLLKLLSFFTLTDLYDGVHANASVIDEIKGSIMGYINEAGHYLNVYKEHIKILHNYIHHITTEITKLKVENDELKVRVKELESRLSFLEERERALEKETVEKR